MPRNQPLPKRAIWIFGAGDLTTSAPLAIVAFFQLFFLTDVARLSPSLAAWPILVGKLWDAVNDPIVGFIADRIRSRFGRRRVLLAIFAVPVGASFVFMWIVPELPASALVVYYTLVYIVFDTCFTIIHIAYNSLTPEMSRDYDEQSSLHGIRMFYSIAGSLLAIVVGTVLQWVIDDMGTVFSLLGFTIGAIIILPPLLVFRVSRDHDAATGGPQASPVKSVREILRNRPFWLVMGLYLSSWTAVSLIAADLVYFARYNLRIPEQANYLVLIAQGVALLFVPLTVVIARRWEKRVALYAGLGSMIPLLVALASVRADSTWPAYLIAALLGFGIATAYVTPWSMIPDVIQWDANRYGRNREASYYSIASFYQKGGTAFALWMMARVLGRRGYVTPTDADPIPLQPDAALASIRHFITVVPSLLLTLSIVLAAMYPISRAVQAQLRERLEGIDAQNRRA